MLHIGNNWLIKKKEIVAILDASVLNSRDTRDFFERAKGSITEICGEYSSIVVTSRGKKQHIYLSPISCSTLYKRSLNMGISR